MENKKPRKPGSGGSRRKINPETGPSKISYVSLYDHQKKWLVENYGGLTKAIKSLLPTELQ